jgi:hypothetical protein
MRCANQASHYVYEIRTFSLFTSISFLVNNNIRKTSMIKSLSHNPTTHACNMPLLNQRSMRYTREASPRLILHKRGASPIISLNILVSALGCFNCENNLSYLSAYILCRKDQVRSSYGLRGLLM